MANVLNRDTLVYLRSVNTPDYPDPPWIRNPDMSAVEGVPRKYWKLVGDTPAEMDQSEKDAVDAAEAAQETADRRADADDSLLQNRDGRALVIRAVSRVLFEEVNLLRQQLGMPQRTWPQMITAVRGKISNGEAEA